MLDMDRRLQPVRRNAFAVLGIALVASSPWIGLWTLIPLAVAALIFRLADAHVEKARKPENAMFAAWASSGAIIAISVALCGGPLVATMAWLTIPIVTLSARFSGRGILAGVVWTLVLLLATSFGVNAAAVLDDPTLVIAPSGMIIAVAMLSTALMRSDVEHRSEAVIDQLTGMLNRKALETRVQELHHQSLVTGEPIGVLIGDLDCFKRVNDEHGHAVGDGVLIDVAYVIRKHLRAFDLTYRIGGEEFLVLLPGSDAAGSAEVAESLRRAVSVDSVGGRSMTISFGVSASARGGRFDYDAVFAEADAALYEAKRSGRNRVCIGRPLGPGSAPAPAPALA